MIMKRALFLFSAVTLVAAGVPSVAFACERCFGAAADSPIVSAIGISMLSLLVLVGFVFGGIFSFFSRSNARAREMERVTGEAERIVSEYQSHP